MSINITAHNDHHKFMHDLYITEMYRSGGIFLLLRVERSIFTHFYTAALEQEVKVI